MVGCAAAGAALVGFFAANVVYRQLTALLLVPEQGFPLAPGGVEQWLIVTIILGLAGVIEEPVFVGVAVLLWRRLDRRNFLIAATVSTLARASIHLYYAGGTANATITAIALVILWCAMWSGFNLFLVYRTRRLWPVMLAHGLQNAFAAAAGPWTVTATPQDQLAVAGMVFLMLGILALIAIGSLAFVLTRIRRGWHARLTDDHVAPTHPEDAASAGRDQLADATIHRGLGRLTESPPRKPRTASQILNFMADPPSSRHEDENSAIVDENRQAELKPLGQLGHASGSH
jgi:membrane protease YdiL (CAAX protease family)